MLLPERNGTHAIIIYVVLSKVEWEIETAPKFDPVLQRARGGGGGGG